MKFLKQVAAALLSGAALMTSGLAQADTSWAWSYTGTGVSASGTFTTAGAALVPEDILSISGSRNGVAILGLVPVGEDGNFAYDNQFANSGNYFTDAGMLYDVGGGDAGHFNVYFFEGQHFDLQVVDGQAIETPISFSVTAVPEAATYVYMALGLAGIGALARRRKLAPGAAA